MGQYWLGKTKLSDKPKMLSKSCYGICLSYEYFITNTESQLLTSSHIGVALQIHLFQLVKIQFYIYTGSITIWDGSL